MSNEEPRLIFPALNSNGWGTADTGWISDLTRVQRAFNAYVAGELRFAQEDPRAGKLPDVIGDTGRSLVKIGERMQEDARIRTACMLDFGVPILKHLASLPPDARVSAWDLVQVIGTFDGNIELVLRVLAQSGAVHVHRPRVGATTHTIKYWITPEGRTLIELPAVGSSLARQEIGGGDAETR